MHKVSFMDYRDPNNINDVALVEKWAKLHTTVEGIWSKMVESARSNYEFFLETGRMPTGFEVK